VTALRISNFNVIAAIRDLPQPPSRRGRLRTYLLSAVGLVVGGGIAYLGLTQEVQAAAMAGVPLVAFSLIPLMRPILGDRWSGVVGSTIAMAWGILVFSLFPDVMREADIDVFVVQGVVLVAAAVTLSASASAVWSKAINGMSRAGAGLSTRLGLVYPLARRGRTGLLLGMFSLVVFTITFLSVFSQIMSDQTSSLADDSAAGFDIVAASAAYNPATLEQVSDVEGVALAAPLTRAFAEFDVEGEDDPLPWRVTGFDERLIQLSAPVLGSRLPEYETDMAAFEAVISDSSLLIVDDFFLDNGSGPGGERYLPGERVELITESGEKRTMTIVGVLASDFVFAGSYASADLVDSDLEKLSGQFYVSAEAGTDAELVAGRLNAALIDYGMDAQTFDSSVEAEVAETIGIFRLFQGFLSLGLLIGIAGLAVVLVRAVHERRRAIGVLRAIGAQAGTIRRSFLVESGFVAIQGVAIGAVLGLITAYQVIVSSDTFGDADFQFSWPWVGLAVVMIVPTAAALLAAAIPSKRAAAITPAVALRSE
ncbi:MAG: FtsX-like permease family protein, partial [Acidimicrobiia bacterium]